MSSVRASKSSIVYEQLRLNILTCKIQPDEILNEGRIADQFGVSKTPAREALGLMAQEGLVVPIPRLGYRVTPITLRDVDQLFGLRVVLETGTAEILGGRINQAQTSELRRLARGQSESPGYDEGYLSVVQSNKAFHLRIAEMTANKKLADLVGIILDEMGRVLCFGASRRDILPETQDEHERLADVIGSGNSERARSAMRDHIMNTKERIINNLVEIDLGPR